MFRAIGGSDVGEAFVFVLGAMGLVLIRRCVGGLWQSMRGAVRGEMQTETEGKKRRRKVTSVDGSGWIGETD